MITLNFGTRSFPLTKDEASFIAESLTNAFIGKPATSPVFNSGMHGHISILGKNADPAKKKADKVNTKLRSNPQQSDQVLTDC